MKIDHIRNAIDAQRNVMFQIIEKKGGQQHFLLQMQQNQLTNRARGNQMSSVDNLFKKLPGSIEFHSDSFDQMQKLFRKEKNDCIDLPNL